MSLMIRNRTTALTSHHAQETPQITLESEYLKCSSDFVEGAGMAG
jgi:hypothetical protein